MKLILIDGGPASGKNTLGELLVQKLTSIGEQSVLLDLDAYVEKYNPKWIWTSNEQKDIDQINARKDFYGDINKYLKDNFNVIAIGERFMTTRDVGNMILKLDTNCEKHLYHLSIPFAIREERLHMRGSHSLIDLKKDQQDRDAIKVWPGYVFANIRSPQKDVDDLLTLIQQNKGLIK